MRPRAAFTLVEMLVAVAVFGIATGIIADLFLVASRQQQRTSAVSRLQADARFVVESIARDIREGVVFSDATYGAAISVRRRDGTASHYRRSTGDCPAGVASCIAIGRPDAGGMVQFASLTGAEVEADAFDVMTMETAPYAAVIHVVLSTAGGRAGERVRAEAQTTLVSRVYEQ